MGVRCGLGRRTGKMKVRLRQASAGGRCEERAVVAGGMEG
jgi:hypothetical protein